MATCEHLAWLHVTNAKEITLLNPGRMTRVIDELTKPATQQPSILLFLGRKAKNLAVRELFPENNIRKGQRDGLATLRVDNSSLYSDYPILFAESDPITTISSAANLSSCHETESISLQWSKVTAVHDLYDILHARLFCLFTDVLCVFAEDFATFDDVVKRLKAWAAAGSASNLCKQIRPRVVIIKRGSEPSPSPTYNYLETQDLHFNLHQQDLMEFYSSITVLHLADEQISPLARFRRLKELLWRQMDEMRQERRKNRCLYSAVHLNDFFEKAVAHTAASIVQPFDFILASRQNNAVGSDYQDHLTSFLRLGTKHKISYDVMMGFIASTILLDAYPPLMHKFGSELYYETIYHHSCSKSLINSYKEQLFTERQVEEQAREQEEHVKTYLNNLFSDMISSGKTAAQMHREKIKNLSISWSKLKSNKTCLWCLRRRPENTLSCGHAICNVCVRIFGTEMPILECQYYVRACLLCHFGDLTVRLKPFSAGHRILCIDGGGTRGVLPFERLAIIQDIMGPEYPLQDLFDIAFGTSVGGLIVLILFRCRVPISQSIQIFNTLAQQLFQRPRGRTNIFRYLRHFLRSWYFDGYYDSIALEASLKANLENGTRMFGYQSGVFATKVGVTAATIGDASPIIFTNYNGSGTRKKDCGYEHIRPENIEEEPYIWETGRGTSAAPVLYQSVQIKASGPVQDGAMSGHNNPVKLAVWESLQIDPSVPKPDIVVSLGTGTKRAPASPKHSSFRHVLLDGAAPRLWRSYMASFDGERFWNEFMNHIDKENREDYIRLNSILSRDELAIDNVDRTTELRENLRTQPESIPDCEKTLYALLISAFFFELCSAPKFLQEGRYHCHGIIRCRLQGETIVKLLTQFSRSSLAFVIDTETLGHYEGDQDLCISCRQYQKSVEFSVRHPTESTSIYVQSVTQGRRTISAFPQTMKWFTCQQHLNAHFGTAYHRDLQHRMCRTCNINVMRQRSVNLKRKEDWIEKKNCKKPRL